MTAGNTGVTLSFELSVDRAYPINPSGLIVT